MPIPAVTAPSRPWSVPALLGAVAFCLGFFPGILGSYGPFIDELYYVACAKRLAWGYVDHPPLAPFLLRLALLVGGEHLVVLRLLSSTFAALTVFGTGMLAWRLGSGPFGQALASVAMLSAPIAQVIVGFYSMNAMEPLLWLVLCWLLVEIARGAHPATWIAFGTVAGIAAMTKHTVVTFLVAAAVAVVVTPARRHLRSPWPWIGAAVAGVIVAPNVIWQAVNGWPSLEFYRNAALDKNQPIGPLQVLGQQLTTMSPGTIPVWLAGLGFLFRTRIPADLRHLAITFLILLGSLMLSGQSRPDRIVGIYPLLFAAGSVAIATYGATRRWVRATAMAWVLAWGIALLPVGVPILPPEPLASYAASLGLVPQIERGEGKQSALPQWFADRLGWEALIDDVAAVRDALPEAERRDVVYIAPSYGQAGALEWLGASRGLAPVYSNHNSYYFWGPPPRKPPVAIIVGFPREALDTAFERVDLARRHECGLCMPWRNRMPIWVARGPRVDLAALWPRWRHFE